MKTLREQIENRCKHYTGRTLLGGASRETCAAGVPYGKSWRELPCFRDTGASLTCAKRAFPTPTEGDALREQFRPGLCNNLEGWAPPNPAPPSPPAPAQAPAAEVACPECGGEGKDPHGSGFVCRDCATYYEPPAPAQEEGKGERDG